MLRQSLGYHGNHQFPISIQFPCYPQEVCNSIYFKIEMTVKGKLCRKVTKIVLHNVKCSFLTLNCHNFFIVCLPKKQCGRKFTLSPL